MATFGFDINLTPTYGAYLVGTFISNMYVPANTVVLRDSNKKSSLLGVACLQVGPLHTTLTCSWINDPFYHIDIHIFQNIQGWFFSASNGKKFSTWLRLSDNLLYVYIGCLSTVCRYFDASSCLLLINGSLASLFELVHGALGMHVLYYYLINHFFSPVALLSNVW